LDGSSPTPEDLKAVAQKQRAKDKEKRGADNPKKFSDVRVIQRNLVYVTNLALSAAKEEILRRQEYFGRFGKIVKIVINRNHVYSGPQGPSVSAYITYSSNGQAHSAIKAMDGTVADGRVLRASFGTTKYCTYFLRNIRCPNPDCMYLHDAGATADSFTKEDMAQGKHLLSNKPTGGVTAPLASPAPSAKIAIPTTSSSSSSAHSLSPTARAKPNTMAWKTVVCANAGTPPSPPKIDQGVAGQQTHLSTSADSKLTPKLSQSQPIHKLPPSQQPTPINLSQSQPIPACINDKGFTTTGELKFIESQSSEGDEESCGFSSSKEEEEDIANESPVGSEEISGTTPPAILLDNLQNHHRVLDDNEEHSGSLDLSSSPKPVPPLRPPKDTNTKAGLAFEEWLKDKFMELVVDENSPRTTLNKLPVLPTTGCDDFDPWLHPNFLRTLRQTSQSRFSFAQAQQQAQQAQQSQVQQHAQHLPYHHFQHAQAYQQYQQQLQYLQPQDQQQQMLQLQQQQQQIQQQLVPLQLLQQGMNEAQPAPQLQALQQQFHARQQTRPNNNMNNSRQWPQAQQLQRTLASSQPPMQQKVQRGAMPQPTVSMYMPQQLQLQQMQHMQMQQIRHMQQMRQQMVPIHPGQSY